eukprot:GCRY01004572.1.p1 GENE.GCRY01004572.1~~GCRY01004572.1.p1  ORF type:complete len:732 (-),score=179.83 GCRY01004572.1:8-2203(-)
MQNPGGTQPETTPLSLPLVISFLQNEFRSFEREKFAWKAEKASYEQQISILSGQKAGLELTKRDLLRRIQMLEHALRQERQKYSTSGAPPTTVPSSTNPAPVRNPVHHQKMEQKLARSKHILTQYMKEIGADALKFDFRTNPNMASLQPEQIAEPLFPSSAQTTPPKQESASSIPSEATTTQIASSTPLFESSANTTADSSHYATPAPEAFPQVSAFSSAEEPASAAPSSSELTLAQQEALSILSNSQNHTPLTETAANEADFSSESLGQEPTQSQAEAQENEVSGEKEKSSGKEKDKEKKKKKKKAKNFTQFSARDLKHMMMNKNEEPDFGQAEDDSGSISSRNESLEADSSSEKIDVSPSNDIGELADVALTSTEANRSGGGEVEPEFKKQWKLKYTLRSHLDGVRSIDFHSTEPVLLSGSEDGLVKLWNLRNLPSGGRKTLHSPDVEPVVTLRGHLAPVTSVIIADERGLIFSASLDGTIRLWDMPDICSNPYTSYGSLHTLMVDTYAEHQDAVWEIGLHPTLNLLASVSADKTICIHDTDQKIPLQHRLRHPSNEDAVPTSCAFVHSDLRALAVGFTTGEVVVYDINTEAVICSTPPPDNTTPDCALAVQVNKVVSHPTLSLLAVAYEDKSIRFVDPATGVLTHTMVAHLDSVASLSIHHAGIFMVSAGHDCSLRFWDVERKNCVQECSAHRPKRDEGILAVAFHPKKQYLASAGADSTIRVYIQSS